MFSNSEQTYGAAYLRAVDVFAGFFGNGGVKVVQTPFVYTEYLNNYYFGYRSGASTQGPRVTRRVTTASRSRRSGRMRAR